MDGDVTSKDSERWKAFMREWVKEHKPGQLIVGGKTYQVIQMANGERIFRPVGGQSAYDSFTSFR